MTAQRPSTATVGELFPASDLIAQWTFQLTTFVEALAVEDALLHDALDHDLGPTKSGYHYRQVITRLYEARRAIVVLDAHEDLRGWVDQIAGVQTPLGTLRAAYLPLNGSRVESEYGLTRRVTVHHSMVGSAELEQILTDSANEDARIVLDHGHGRATYEWPEAAIARSLFGDLAKADRRAAFEARIRFATELARAFILLAQAAVDENARRRGVDRERFTQHLSAP